MKTLHLTIKKKWFDMLGEKLEEYREIKPYWFVRLFHEDEDDTYWPRWFDVVEFKNGYGPTSPVKTFEFCGTVIRDGNPEWGAEPDKKYFVILLGKKY